MSDLLDRFPQFCRQLTIESKELGVVRLNPNGAQRYVMAEIAKGLSDDIHTFIILKARQLGISTITLALDLYWQYRCPGIQGTLVTDTDENKEYFRSILKSYMTNLDPSARGAAVETLNRTLLAFDNRSRLMFQVAGVRSASGNLGRGKGINQLHGTECAFWADQDGLASLIASLAQKNQKRLYVMESTANGYNAWYDICQSAKDATMRRFIFVAWWMLENYACAKGTPQFETYAGEPSPEEWEWMEEVNAVYGHTITQEQLAWWRWQLYEEIIDPSMMMQEYPPTESMAWVMSGSAFFTTRSLTEAYNTSKKRPPEQYHYEFGAHFYDTKIVEDPEGELFIWEKPVKGAKYVVGADPAWGASDTSDYYALQIFRCYSDGMDQVAEFRSRAMTAYKFAWIIAHLAGAYRAELNLELNGPGTAVHHELEKLQAEAAYLDKNPPKDDKNFDKDVRLRDVLGGISYYLYFRPDSVARNASSYHTITSNRIKTTYMHNFRDGFERGQIRLRSPRLLAEMRNVREEGGRIAAAGHGNDDLTIACGLATLTWVQWIQPAMMTTGRTRAQEHQTQAREVNVVQTAVSSFLAIAEARRLAGNRQQEAFNRRWRGAGRRRP